MRGRERREPVEAIQIKPGEIKVGKGVFFKDEEDEYVELYKKRNMKFYKKKHEVI